MALLTAYVASAGITMQLYRAKPRQAKPPTGYIEGIEESLTEYTLTTRQRTTRARVRLLWRDDVDAGAAVDQRDAFVDGFLDWVADNYHAFGDNTLASAVSVSDDPDFAFEDSAHDGREAFATYFSTVLTLEGFAAT